MNIPTITIWSEGQEVYYPEHPDVDIQHEVNKVPYACLSFPDGDPGKPGFILSSQSDFAPGKTLEIKIGTGESDQTTIFKGIIVKHALEASGYASLLSLELKGDCVKMTNTRKSVVHTQGNQETQKEEDVLAQVIEANGLEADLSAQTWSSHEELVQYYSSDWDFLLTRADLYGYWVVATDGKVSVVNPKDVIDANEAKYEVVYGDAGIFNLHLEINAEHQAATINTLAWDAENNDLTEKTQAEDFVAQKPAANAQSDVEGEPADPTALAEAIGNEEETLQSIVPLSVEEQKGWADGKMLKSRLAMLRGSFTLDGNAEIQPLDLVSVTGFNAQFDGNTIISGVRHRLGNDGWYTDIQFGISPDNYTKQNAIEAQNAAGLLPGIQGLQVGVVDAFEEDKQGQFRVRVKIPALGDIVWARLTSPDAGKDNRGMFFRPDEGDEVVVGFMNNDPRQAIILGSVFGAKLPPPHDPDETNAIKGIFSKAGLQLKMDDENKTLELLTSEDQYLKIEDGTVMEMKDTHGNSITMNDKGIVLKSDGDITISASGDVTIEGAKVDVK
ncbi:type VI secretion system tip protein VgrG [Microscilla marina]|uniref:Rhs element Vgr protein n=1 Tax=Microscilla marina ATCC 23134 TaxID=313606 RepID=A1ZC10_MICM2|nr:type VI secretion system tip protein VgrG [Microscilla marina]EAY31812.1 Rhs element Vgr protein [Microscilla marina ATCC 23134]